MRILLLLCHPDDETLLGGSLGRFAELQAQVQAIYLTRGEGTTEDFTGQGLHRIAETRAAELAAAAKWFNIERYEVLGLPDRFPKPPAGQRWPSVEDFEQAGLWERSRIARSIGEYCRTFRPQVCIAMQPDCPGLHVHHQALGNLARDYFEQGLFGREATELWAISETGWYPSSLFPTVHGQLAFPLGAHSPALKMSYADFAHQGASFHKSQGTSRRPASWQGPEIFLPLAGQQILLPAWLTGQYPQVKEAEPV